MSPVLQDSPFSNDEAVSPFGLVLCLSLVPTEITPWCGLKAVVFRLYAERSNHNRRSHISFNEMFYMA